jgi:hypothetical protein
VTRYPPRQGGTRKARGDCEAGLGRYGVSAKYHPGEIEVQERAGVRAVGRVREVLGGVLVLNRLRNLYTIDV